MHNSKSFHFALFKQFDLNSSEIKDSRKLYCSSVKYDRSTEAPFMALKASVTRSGDLLDFGQLFEAFGNK